MSILDDLLKLSNPRKKELLEVYLKVRSMGGEIKKEETLQTLQSEMNTNNPNISNAVNALNLYRQHNYVMGDRGFSELNSIIERLNTI